MDRRTIPGTDLTLSVVGFGAWAIGGVHWGDDVSDERSIAAIHRAIDLGINWFDTAPIYGWGHADALLAATLVSLRDEVVIATKVGVGKMEDGHVHSRLTAAHLREDLEASLRRLRVETIDLLQVHWPCEYGTPLDATFEALTALHREGKFRYLGACNYAADPLREIAAIAPLVSLQTRYNLLARGFERELAGAARDLGLGVLAFEPLARGLLSGKFTRLPAFTESDLRMRDDRFRGRGFLHAQALNADLAKVARHVGLPPAALCIGWAAAQPGITAVIAGMKGPEQVEENVQAARVAAHGKLCEIVGRIADTHGGTPPP